MKKSLAVLFLVFFTQNIFTQNIIPITFKLDQSIYKGEDKEKKIAAGCFEEKQLEDLVGTLKELGLDKCDLENPNNFFKVKDGEVNFDSEESGDDEVDFDDEESSKATHTIPALIVAGIVEILKGKIFKDNNHKKVCADLFEMFESLCSKHTFKLDELCILPPFNSCTLPAFICDDAGSNKNLRQKKLKLFEYLDLSDCDLNKVAYEHKSEMTHLYTFDNLSVSCTLPALALSRGFLQALKKLKLEKCDVNRIVYTRKQTLKAQNAMGPTYFSENKSTSYTLPALIIVQISKCEKKEERSSLCKVFNKLNFEQYNPSEIVFCRKFEKYNPYNIVFGQKKGKGKHKKGKGKHKKGKGKHKKGDESYTLSDLIKHEIEKCQDEQVRSDLKKVAEVVNKLNPKKSDAKEKEIEKPKANKSVEIQQKQTNIDKIGKSVGKDSLQINNASIGGDKLCNEIVAEVINPKESGYKKNFIYSGFFSALMNLAWEAKKRNIEKNTPEVAIKAVTSGGLAATISYLATKFGGKYTSSAKLNIPLSSIVGCVVTNLTFPIVKKRCEKIALKCNLKRLYNSNMMRSQKALNA